MSYYPNVYASQTGPLLLSGLDANFNFAVDIQSQSLYAAAGGSSDVITATLTPAVTALISGLTLYIRAGSANTTTTPTFAPNGLTAATIKKINNQALAAGDIAGAGHVLILQYDATNSVWQLANPATTSATKINGILPVANGGTGNTTGAGGIQAQVFTASGTFTIPTGITSLEVTVVGGGASNDTNSALSGPGGGTAIKYLTGLTPGNTLAVTVGAGGVLTAGTGGNGGTSQVASGTQTITTISATGGNSATQLGGIGSNGTLNIRGGGGSDLSGVGGSSTMGGGGASGTGISGAGGAYGGGAGYRTFTQPANGAAGVVIFKW